MNTGAVFVILLLLNLLGPLAAQDIKRQSQLFLGPPSLSIKDPTNSEWLRNRMFGIAKLANNPASLSAVANLEQNSSNSLTFDDTSFAHIEETFQRQFTKTIFGAMQDCFDVESLHFFDQIQFRRNDLANLCDQVEAGTLWQMVHQKERLSKGTLNPLYRRLVAPEPLKNAVIGKVPYDLILSRLIQY